MKKLLNFRYPFYCFLALLFGIVIAKSLYAGDVESIVLVAISLTFVTCLSFCYKKFIPLIMIFIMFFAGNGLFFLGVSMAEDKSFSGNVSVVGRVSDSSFVKEDNYCNLIVENVKINGERVKNLKLFVGGNSEIEVGDTIAFESEVENVKLFNLGNFNSTYYRNNVGYTASVGTNDLTITKGNMKVDESFRAKVKESLLSNMSEENAYIAYAVLFGDKTMIDDNISQVYRNSGIVHILTVSGLHISFIVACIMLILKLCRSNKYITLIVISAILICYCYLCGFSPSVVRASIMAIVLCLSKICNRPYDSLNSLAIAGFIIVLTRPLSAVDIGFLMSFFCVTSILLLTKPISKLFEYFLPKKIASLIAVSISAQLGILPFVSSFFSTFNFLSVFANLLIIPLFSIIFPLLFVIAFLVALLPFISPIFVIFDFLFNVIYSIASFFANTSLQVPLKPFSFSISALIFVLIFVLSHILVIKPLLRFLFFSISALVLTLSIVLPNLIYKDYTAISFVDSYSGQMIVFKSKNGDCLYYGDDYYYQTFSAMNINFDVDYYLRETISSQIEEKWKGYGARYLISPSYDIDDNEKLSIDSTPLQVGSFSISYFEKAFIINFDSVKILLAQNVDNSFFDLINLVEYDIIFLGDNMIEKDYKSSKVITTRDCDFSTYNLLRQGNFMLMGENLQLRGLD